MTDERKGSKMGAEKKSLLDLSDIMSILEEDSPASKQSKVVEDALKEAESVMNNVPEETPVPEPQEPISQPTTPQNTEFVTKLLTDIDTKNEEILKLRNELMSIKYELKEKELMIKDLRLHMDEISRRTGDVKTVAPDIAPPKPVKAEEPAYNVKDDEPADEDVASIFRRIQQSGEEEPAPEEEEDSRPRFHDPYSDKPQPPRKIRTAKLYDL